MTDAIHSRADAAESPPVKSYDDKLKSIVCEWLQDELTLKQDETAHTIGDEKLVERQQRRKLGKIVAWTSGVVSLLVLIMMLALVMRSSSPLYGMEPLPQAVFISASFLCFIAVFAMLIRGMFQSPKEEIDSSPIKEAAEILRDLRSGE